MLKYENSINFEIDVIWYYSSVKSLSRVQLLETPWTAAHQASLSITNSRSLPKLMSIESVMPSSHFILCRPLLLLSPIPPSIRVFSNESTLRMRWPKYWSFSFSIPSKKELCLFIICIYSDSKVIYLESRESVSLSWQSAIPGSVMENNSVMKDKKKTEV